jgi:hypothetical protein
MPVESKRAESPCQGSDRLGTEGNNVTGCGKCRRGGSGPELRFGVHVRNDNRDRTPPLVRLKALCGPGDAGEPVVTVMLPNGH